METGMLIGKDIPMRAQPILFLEELEVRNLLSAAPTPLQSIPLAQAALMQPEPVPLVSADVAAQTDQAAANAWLGQYATAFQEVCDWIAKEETTGFQGGMFTLTQLQADQQELIASVETELQTVLSHEIAALPADGKTIEQTLELWQAQVVESLRYANSLGKDWDVLTGEAISVLAGDIRDGPQPVPLLEGQESFPTSLLDPGPPPLFLNDPAEADAWLHIAVKALSDLHSWLHSQEPDDASAVSWNHSPGDTLVAGGDGFAEAAPGLSAVGKLAPEEGLLSCDNPGMGIGEGSCHSGLQASPASSGQAMPVPGTSSFVVPGAADLTRGTEAENTDSGPITGYAEPELSDRGSDGLPSILLELVPLPDREFTLIPAYLVEKCMVPRAPTASPRTTETPGANARVVDAPDSRFDMPAATLESERPVPNRPIEPQPTQSEVASQELDAGRLGTETPSASDDAADSDAGD